MNRSTRNGIQESFSRDVSLAMPVRQASLSPPPTPQSRSPTLSRYCYNNGLQGRMRRDIALVMPVRQAFLSAIEPISIVRTNYEPKSEVSSIGDIEKVTPRRSLFCCSSGEDFVLGDWPGSEINLISPQYDCKRDSRISDSKDKVPFSRSSLWSYSEGRTIRHGKQTGTGVTKKYVRFAPKRSNSTAIIMSLDEYTAKEHRACWYSQEELDTMLHRAMPLHQDISWSPETTLELKYEGKVWSKISSK